MDEKKRVLSLILIMATSSLIVTGVAITMLYHASFKENQARLVETAQSQARLIEAVARFDERYSKSYPNGPEAATLSQIIDAHEHYRGFGDTGEFTLSKKEKDNIVFLLSHRHFDLDRPRPVAFNSKLAEPMRLALLGRSGTVVGLDYRGEVVMAAHEPVAELDLGIVAKIDLSEIRAPFFKAGAIAGLFTVLVVLAGASLFIKITNPMIRQLEKRTVELKTLTDEMRREIKERRLAEEALRKSEETYHNLFEHANDSIFIVDLSTLQFLDANENAAKRLGYTREELLQLTIDDIATPMPDSHRDGIFRELLSAGSVTFEHVHLRKDKTEMPVEISSRTIGYSDRQVFQSIVRDITGRKRIEQALSWEADVNNALSELSRTLLSISSIEEISSQVLQCSKKLTASAFGYTGYIDPENGYLICPTMTRDIWERCRVKEKSIIFKSYHGLWGWVVKNRSPLLTNSASQDPRSAGIPEGHLPIHRFLSAPAMISNELVGQIALANSAREYTEKDLTLIKRLADIYAIAVQRKRAEDAILKAHDDLEQRVQIRTTELSKTNQKLRHQIFERKNAEIALLESEKELKLLSKQLLSAEENERKRIARELHDGIGQALSAIKFSVENSLITLRNDSSNIDLKILEAIVPMAQETIEDVRRIVQDLRPSILDDLGILATISWVIREFQTIYSKIHITKDITVKENEITVPLKTVIFRILQEALNNIAKHSRADSVRLCLNKSGGRIYLIIDDNGKGFDVRQTFFAKPSKRGFGLASMRERAQLSDGTFDITSAYGQGTILSTSWPL